MRVLYMCVHARRFAFTQPDELAFDEADLIKWLAMELSKKH